MNKHIFRIGYELVSSERDANSRIAGLQQFARSGLLEVGRLQSAVRQLRPRLERHRIAIWPGHLSMEGVTMTCGADITDIIVGAGTRTAVPGVGFREPERVRDDGKQWDGASEFKAK